MFRCNNFPVFIVACTIAALASAAGSEKTKDHGLPYRPISAELRGGDRNELDGLDESAFARLSLDDVLLKRAYHRVFQSGVGGKFQNLEPGISAALADMRRRGDTVTPMVLKLMDENHETGIETSVLVMIPEVGSIQLGPYLDYARKVLRERTQTMSGSLAGCAAMLLASHGTKEDAELLMWVMEVRPYVAPPVTNHLDSLNLRLGLPKTSPRRTPKDHATTGGATSGNPQGTAGKTSGLADVVQQAATHWLFWVLPVLGAAGLLSLVIKKRK